MVEMCYFKLDKELDRSESKGLGTLLTGLCLYVIFSHSIIHSFTMSVFFYLCSLSDI